MSKELSCGVLVECPTGILLGHATGTPRWDIPKGRIEEGETPMAAALREAYEETGLDLAHHSGSMIDLGAHAYLPKKNLHVFHLLVPEAFSLAECKCHSWMEVGGRSIPEMDRFAWFAWDQVQGKVGKSLWAYFEARGLVPAKPTGAPAP